MRVVEAVMHVWGRWDLVSEKLRLQRLLVHIYIQLGLSSPQSSGFASFLLPCYSLTLPLLRGLDDCT